MSTVILGALGVLVLVVGGFAVALASKSRAEFAEQNEVVPGHKSPAPASWAGAHSPEARLHRRLGDAVRAAHAQARLDELGLASMVREMEQQALALDERLVAAAALPARHRDAAIERLVPSVEALEDAAAALVETAALSDTSGGGSKAALDASVAEADLRMQALLQARAEVEQLDRLARGDADLGENETGENETGAGETGAGETGTSDPGDGDPGTATASPTPG